MAVTQSSDDNSKKPVETGIEPSQVEGADAGPCGLTQLRKSDGPSTRHRDISMDTCGIVKSYKLKRNRTKSNESDSLSDIDDAEVLGYLNKKEEIYYKRILWEAMHGKSTEAKKQKRTTETKKGVSVKKATTKTTTKAEFQRPSSRINYDALKILNDELEHSSEATPMISSDSYGSKNSQYGLRGSTNSDMSCCKDDEDFGHHDGEMRSEYGDEYVDDEYFDF
ncbi:uncharacterized protein LOC105164882 [Sesamum indicum]|uniref:Uncharacterized protein LOC105164882 n=1 Tax=Sesamum indicum TaxID=4182 RepID=A0A6I9TGI2_SESIN|nr:uncharacterized protein LOC105164882 [Sesamum indicum]